MQEKRIEIAFISASDARDKNASSGAFYYMAQALTGNIGRVSFIAIPAYTQIIIECLSFVFKAVNRALLFFFHKRYYRHNILIAKLYGSSLSRSLRAGNFDLIFSIKANNQIAFLETDIPIVYASDATFDAMLDYYPEFSDLVSLSKWEGEIIERRAIQKAAICTFHCRWALNSAITHYHADPARVFFNITGANIDREYLPSHESLSDKRVGKSIVLLFIGVDWIRKGGDIAYRTMVALNDKHCPASLIICGCEIPSFVEMDCRVKYLRYFNKNDPDQCRMFYGLYLEADWLILPTRAECLATVFLEAAGFGIPSIGPDTGGTCDAVVDGVTGYLMPYEAGGDEYADKIDECYKQGLYPELSRTSRKFYDEFLNWDVWAGNLNKCLARAGLPHADNS